MRKIKMEEISNFNDLKENDYLLILFNRSNNFDLIYKLYKDDCFVTEFDETVYVFDRSMELIGKYNSKNVDKLIRVSRE